MTYDTAQKNPTLAAMVKAILEQAKNISVPSMAAPPRDAAYVRDWVDKASEADKIVVPLANELKRLGIIEANDSWYCEWDGVYEFGAVPIFWGPEGLDDLHCLNVYDDGCIDICN